jgi:hypothetical protein
MPTESSQLRYHVHKSLQLSYADDMAPHPGDHNLDPMLCPLNSVHTCISYILPLMTKSNFPYYEKDLQAVAEHGLQDKRKERPSSTLLCNGCYCLLCMAINAHTIDLLIHINSLHISALVHHSKACFMLSLQYQI